MESLDLESKLDMEPSPEPFLGMLNIEEADNDSDNDVHENAASVLNPNKNDPRRLFQEFKPEFTWDPDVPYSEQPNRLEQGGPRPLDFPGHFLEVEGGISLIYWMDDKSCGCLCTVSGVDEENRTFNFQAFSYQGKKKKTFFDTGKEMVANENQVWRLIHRTEFEATRKQSDIRRGQVVRIQLINEVTDFTGYVQEMKGNMITVLETTGIHKNRLRNFELSKVATVVEILSSPLFYRLRRLVAGEQKGGKNIAWEPVSSEKSDDVDNENIRKPKMLLTAPTDCKYKRT